jgi:uncharacterized membrane protein YccC
LELDEAFWAGLSAALACQPSLGGSLRKSWFLLVGTVAGAVAIVLLSAAFPQQRVGFFLGLALWGAACGLMATLLRNFASYASATAGFTAVLIASADLGATGGANGGIFMIAVTRASEICIGIICAGAVLVATDFGDARRRLAVQLAAILTDVAGNFAGTFSLAGPDQSKTKSVRRALTRRIVALDPVIDEALGEASDLRYHAPELQTAIAGLFSALSSWRIVATHLEQLPDDQSRREAEFIRSNLPRELQSAPLSGETASWTADPSRVRKACAAATRALTVLPAHTPSLRLLADESAMTLIGIKRALNGLLLLVDCIHLIPGHRATRHRVPDFLPPVVNAARVFVTIGAVELWWVITGWPNGAFAITFAAIVVLLFSPRADKAYAVTIYFMIGTSIAIVLAAILEFAVLPRVTTFAGFSLALGMILLPSGVLIARLPIATPIATFFLLQLAPANQASYNTQQFYNTALSIVVGGLVGALAFRLLPPLPSALRSRRLLELTLRDLRRLTAGPLPRTASDWQDRIYNRLFALPEQAEPLQRAQLLAALSMGTEIIRLRRIARRFDRPMELETALEAVARGDISAAIEHLGQVDGLLKELPGAVPAARVRLRARASVLAMSEALAEHAAYFESGATR